MKIANIFDVLKKKERKEREEGRREEGRDDGQGFGWETDTAGVREP